MNINVAELLNGNYILLLFVVLALGLCLGKLRLGSIQLGNSIGVLVVSLLLGQQHFSINTDALNLGFMLFRLMGFLLPEIYLLPSNPLNHPQNLLA